MCDQNVINKKNENNLLIWICKYEYSSRKILSAGL